MASMDPMDGTSRALTPPSSKPRLDPYQRPPEGIRSVYKKFQKMDRKTLDSNTQIIDFSNFSVDKANVLSVASSFERKELLSHFQAFSGNPVEDHLEESLVHMYEHRDIPGLFIIPSLLPPSTQTTLLSRLLHTHLSNPSHLTNLHTHYTLSYPPTSTSFFSLPPTEPKAPQTIATPHDPTLHRPLPLTPLLTRKLRWLTLGGQYNWTTKTYPSLPPPPFPADIKQLLESLFPETKSEAAIVNLYSPGDTLSLHRDVAESCGRGLVSVSLGCEAVFVIGDVANTTASSSSEHQRQDQPQSHNQESNDPPQPPPASKTAVLRLRSGDVVYMSGASRFAWHGVPQILPNTCPEYLREWPARGSGEEEEGGEYEAWRGWMAGKRVNLNVRQMWE